MSLKVKVFVGEAVVFLDLGIAVKERLKTKLIFSRTSVDFLFNIPLIVEVLRGSSVSWLVAKGEVASGEGTDHSKSAKNGFLHFFLSENDRFGSRSSQ